MQLPGLIENKYILFTYVHNTTTSLYKTGPIIYFGFYAVLCLRAALVCVALNMLKYPSEYQDGFASTYLALALNIGDCVSVMTLRIH